MNTKLITTQPPIKIPDEPSSGNSYFGIGSELLILGLATVALFKRLINSGENILAANEELIKDLRDTIKEKEQELEAKNDEILTLRADNLRFQKQIKSYERAFYTGFSNQGLANNGATTESN